jgi:hypothetical protein
VSIHLRVAGSVCLGLALIGCAGSAATTAGAPTAGSASLGPIVTAVASDGPSFAAIPSPTVAATAGPPTSGPFALTADVWWSGYAISVTGGDYDPVKHALAIDATFLNTSTQDGELRQLSDGVSVVWNSQFLTAYVTAGAAPVGVAVKGQIQVQTPPGFVVADAVLTFGRPDQHQATVPLDGAAAASEQPSTLTIVGTLKMGKYITFKVTSAMLVPAACTGYPDRIRFEPLKSTLVSMLIWGTAKSTDPLNYGHTDQGYLVLADGTKVVSDPAMSLSIPNGATIHDQGMCFALAEPGSGAFTLKIHEYRSNATGSLKVLIP